MAGPKLGPLRRLLQRFRPTRRLRLTKDGRYFVFITIAIGMAAVNTGNNLLYLLLGWLLSVIIASGVMSDMSLRALRVRRRPPSQVHANRPFLMEISIENLKRQISSFSVEVEDLVADKPLDKKCYFLKIPPGRTQRTSYRHTISRRGLHQFDGFRIASKFPFALFRKSRDLDLRGELLVLPEVFPVRTPRPQARHLGETAAARLGRHGEFFGLREYRDGDDRHDIHWRSTARTGRMMVREYEQEAQQRASILVDNALPVDAEPEAQQALERAISLAASLAKAYLTSGYAVRLIARGCQVPFGSGPIQLTRLLKELALLPTVTTATPYAGAIDPTSDSVLVVPKGIATPPPPTGIGHVMEAR